MNLDQKQRHGALRSLYAQAGDALSTHQSESISHALSTQRRISSRFTYEHSALLGASKTPSNSDIDECADLHQSVVSGRSSQAHS